MDWRPTGGPPGGGAAARQTGKKAPGGKSLRGIAGVLLLVLSGLVILVSGFLPFPWDMGGCAAALMPFYLGASLAFEYWKPPRS